MRISFVSQQPIHALAALAMRTCGCAVAGVKPWTAPVCALRSCGCLVVEDPH